MPPSGTTPGGSPANQAPRLPEDAQERFRTGIPSPARTWNYWLGGKDNYEVDRAVGDATADPRFAHLPAVADGRVTAFLGVPLVTDRARVLGVLCVWDDRRRDWSHADVELLGQLARSAVAEMERQMGLSEDVLRFLTVKVDEHDDQPSAMMRKREDSDGDRGDRGRGPRGDRGDRRPRRDDIGFGAPPAAEGAA